MDTKTHDLNFEMLIYQPLKIYSYYLKLTSVPVRMTASAHRGQLLDSPEKEFHETVSC